MDMPNGKRCDAEIGHAGGLWHACKRKAVVQCVRHYQGGNVLTLHFCAKHEDRKVRFPRIMVSQTITRI